MELGRTSSNSTKFYPSKAGFARGIAKRFSAKDSKITHRKVLKWILVKKQKDYFPVKLLTYYYEWINLRFD